MFDRYDVEIEQAIRLIPFDGRDNDESGAGMFCDLANQMVSDFETFTREERWEALYNAFHKIREATIAETHTNAKAKHDQLRTILADNNCPEFGDAIIDQISTLFGFPDTNA